MIKNLCTIESFDEIYLHKIININCDDSNCIDGKVVFVINNNDKQGVIGLGISKNTVKILSNIIDLEEKEYTELHNKCTKIDFLIQLESEIKINNIDIIIENISDYIGFTSAMTEEKILLRGQANEEWDLKPSIFRNDEENKNEELLYKDIKQWNNNLFSSDSYIRDLCNMQHYGIPTRLIDWTSNPLQALYFATIDKESKEKDAKVYIIKPEDIYDVDTKEYELIEEYFNNRFIKNDDINLELIKILNLKKDNYFFIKTKYYNERIKKQQGYFSVYLDISNNEVIQTQQKIWSSITAEIVKFINTKVNYARNNKLDDIKIIKNIIEKREFINEKVEEIFMFYSKQFGIDNFGEDVKLELFKIMKDGGISIADNICAKKHDMNRILNLPVISIKIASQLKVTLANQLDIMGTNSRAIYPDEQGLAMYMREKYV